MHFDFHSSLHHRIFIMSGIHQKPGNIVLYRHLGQAVINMDISNMVDIELRSVTLYWY